MALAPITLDDLTTTSLEGTGAFDVLMRTTKAHLEAEFAKGRIKGPEYTTVYLGSLEQVLQTALQFLLQKDKASLEAQVIEQEVLKIGLETQKVALEVQMLQASLPKIAAEVALLEAQAAKALKDVEIADEQLALAQAEVAIAQAKLVNLPKEGAVLDAQAAKIAQETANLASQKLGIEAETALTAQKLINAVTENTVLVAQECKLRAEYDVLLEQKLKTAQETQLLTWKVVTEKAQTSELGVDTNSVIGKQKLLYQAQTDGFTRDAEQKAAKIMVDSWNVRRTTDEGTVADATNRLADNYVGNAVARLLAGIGA